MRHSTQDLILLEGRFFIFNLEGWKLSEILFKDSYSRWLSGHIGSRKGEAHRRLKEGHGHAEQMMLRHIWWPSFGHFQHLHPEYEIQDFNEGYRYLDFAYIRSHIKIAIEVDGYGTHLRNISRKQFCDQWIRQMHLTNDNWIVIRIGYDDIEQRPRLWQQLLQQMMGRLFGNTSSFDDLHVYEREIMRLASRLERPFKLADVKSTLNCCHNTARQHIRNLERNEWIKSFNGGSVRTHSWSLEATKHSFIH